MSFTATFAKAGSTPKLKAPAQFSEPSKYQGLVDMASQLTQDQELKVSPDDGTDVTTFRNRIQGPLRKKVGELLAARGEKLSIALSEDKTQVVISVVPAPAAPAAEG